ncbi:MAG: type 1 glutamine amidotransferase domain-containing protein [Rhodobacteraceae bacterium]|nr:MAG: type 1 glutamine amidotransferase domain-containing protein [Paracoccaceae bacterium]
MAQTRILLVLTSNPRFGMHGGETGLAVDTFAAPFYAFEDAGMAAEIATIRGGEPPFAPGATETDATRRLREDVRLMEGLKQAPALRQVQTSVYDAVFLPGGHGAAWDFPACPELTVALEQFALQGKPIAAVGHGAAALVPVMDRRSQPLTRGRKVACPSVEEDREAGVDGVLPFQIESKLRDLGAIIEPAAAFAEKVCVDEFLITGQNAASAGPAAEALIQTIRGARIAA